MIWVYLALILPGLIFLYAVALRPILSRVPQFKQFYTEANGFWGTVWAWCGHSVTILWGKVLGGIGFLLALLDPIASAIGDDNFKAQVANLQLNPKIFGWLMVAISFITIAARVRSMTK